MRESTGEEMFDGSAEFIIDVMPLSEGVMVYTNQDGLKGYIDRFGNIIIKPKFTYASDFINGVALVKYDEGDKEISTFIDKDGNELISNRYRAISINDSVLKVERNSLFSNKKSYLLNNGSLISLPVELNNIVSIYKGRLYSVYDCKFKECLTNFNYKYIINIGDFKESNKSLKYNALIEYVDDMDMKRYGIVTFYNGYINLLQEFAKDRYVVYRINEDNFLVVYVNSYPTHVISREYSIYNISYSNAFGMGVIDKDNYAINDIQFINDKLFYVLYETYYVKYYKLYLYGQRESVSDNKYKKFIYSTNDSDYIIGVKKDGTNVYIDSSGNELKIVNFNISINSSNEEEKEKREQFLKENNHIKLELFNGNYSIGIKKDISYTSNNPFIYNRYIVFDKNLNPVRTFPNSHDNVIFEELYNYASDGVMIGKTTQNGTYAVIDTNTFKIVNYFKCDSFEYENGYFIITRDNKYGLLDKYGETIFDTSASKLCFVDKDNVFIRTNNISIFLNVNTDYENKLLLSDFTVSELTYLGRNVFREKMLDDDSYVTIETNTNDRNYSVMCESYQLLDKKRIKVKIIDSELFIKLEIPKYLETSASHVFENENNYYPKYYYVVREEYKDILEYIDLSSVSFENVDVRGLDFRNTNAIIDPSKVFNKDISNCLFMEENLSSKSFFTDEKGELNFDDSIIHDNVKIFKTTDTDNHIKYRKERNMKISSNPYYIEE